jgi:hypothetical protein
MSDVVNRPEHYTASSIECIDAIDALVDGLPSRQAYYAGNVLKYLWRFSRKNGAEDLKKARWYLDRLIAVQQVGLVLLAIRVAGVLHFGP